jgi:hypothetical protein
VFKHVIWIVFENKSYDSVIGSGSAPYIDSLAHECGLATNYTAEIHPSLPNYIAMTSGSTQGITDDSSPASHPLDVPSIFSQLGSDWRALQESMPTNCAQSNSGTYVVRHNPAAYYTNIDCPANDVPLGLVPDLSAQFTFVTPDLCNDMHDCPVETGDTWLAAFMSLVFASSEYQAGGTAVFITWDEGGSTDQHIPLLVVSPYTRSGTEAGDAYGHYSLLRTTEELLGLDALGGAADAPSMRSAFGLVHEDRLSVPLVSAYQPCTSPNDLHGASLAVPSCNPPSPASQYLTIGSPDVNNHPARSMGRVRLTTVSGSSSTPADEADLAIATSLTDVRRSSDLGDYEGELRTTLDIRLTERGAPPGDAAQTVEDFPLGVTVPCTATPDAAIGSTCSLVTTVDTLLPGAISENQGATWRVGPVRVYDGGADDDADTTEDNTLFMDQGIFVP